MKAIRIQIHRKVSHKTDWEPLELDGQDTFEVPVRANETPETTDCCEHVLDILLGYLLHPADMIKVVQVQTTTSPSDQIRGTNPGDPGKRATAGEIRKEMLSATDILVPVVQRHNTTVCMKVSADEMMGQLSDYKNGDTAPWDIDPQASREGQLVLVTPTV